MIAASKKAFALIPEKPTPKDILAGLKEAAVLKGIGPATASYILAAFQPSFIPVFSDEGFRWALFEEKIGAGWDRKIKYDAKEYAVYLEKMSEVAGRLGVEIEEVERVGFVLGREAIAGSVDGATAGGKKRKVKSEPEGPKKLAKPAPEPKKKLEVEETNSAAPASGGRVLRTRTLKK